MKTNYCIAKFIMAEFTAETDKFSPKQILKIRFEKGLQFGCSNGCGGIYDWFDFNFAKTLFLVLNM